MNASAPTSPVAWLAHFERLCRGHSLGLPEHETKEDRWIGIGFRLGRLRLVAPVGEVAEILGPVPLSRVPHTKAWICGMANVRGNLMPVVDLQAYLHDRQAVLDRLSRILVVSHEGVYCGLLVDAVLGLRHFPHDQRCPDAPGEDDGIGVYMKHAFKAGDEYWSVFSLHKLVCAPRFLEAAL